MTFDDDIDPVSLASDSECSQSYDMGYRAGRADTLDEVLRVVDGKMKELDPTQENSQIPKAWVSIYMQIWKEVDDLRSRIEALKTEQDEVKQ